MQSYQRTGVRHKFCIVKAQSQPHVSAHIKPQLGFIQIRVGEKAQIIGVDIFSKLRYELYVIDGMLHSVLVCVEMCFCKKSFK